MVGVLCLGSSFTDTFAVRQSFCNSGWKSCNDWSDYGCFSVPSTWKKRRQRRECDRLPVQLWYVYGFCRFKNNASDTKKGLLLVSIHGTTIASPQPRHAVHTRFTDYLKPRLLKLYLFLRFVSWCNHKVWSYETNWLQTAIIIFPFTSSVIGPSPCMFFFS